MTSENKHSEKFGKEVVSRSRKILPNLRYLQ